HANRANALRDAMLRSFAVLTVMEPLHFMDMRGRESVELKGRALFEWRCSPFLGPIRRRNVGQVPNPAARELTRAHLASEQRGRRDPSSAGTISRGGGFSC